MHVGDFTRFKSYQEQGLIPLRPLGGQPAACIENALKVLGRDARSVVCLWPIGSHDARPTRPHDQTFEMAFAGEDLPEAISLDWSYASALEIAEKIEEFKCVVWSSSQVFVEAVRRRGSVVSYEPIPPTVLRVRTRACRADPGGWPRLVDTDRTDVAVTTGILFDGSASGPRPAPLSCSRAAAIRASAPAPSFTGRRWNAQPRQQIFAHIQERGAAKDRPSCEGF